MNDKLSIIIRIEQVIYLTIFIVLTVLLHPIFFILGWTVGLITKSFKEGHKEGKDS